MAKIINFNDPKETRMEEELNEIMEDQEARIRQAEMKLNNGGMISEDDWTKMFRNIGRSQSLSQEAHVFRRGRNGS